MSEDEIILSIYKDLKRAVHLNLKGHLRVDRSGEDLRLWVKLDSFAGVSWEKFAKNNDELMTLATTLKKHVDVRLKQQIKEAEDQQAKALRSLEENKTLKATLEELL